MCLDGGWGTNKHFNLAFKNAEFVKDSLLQVGFIINEDKSVWFRIQDHE